MLSKYLNNIDQSTNEDIYYALLEMVQDLAERKEDNTSKKKLYYISAEFLIGKLLSNNLINLGIYDDVKAYLTEHGKNLSEIEEVEPEPSLGNGGLGRLAACFLDSIATLGLNGDGIGLNYHFGLFKQVFEKNMQKEEPNAWIKKKSWLNSRQRLKRPRQKRRKKLQPRPKKKRQKSRLRFYPALIAPLMTKSKKA